MSIKAMKLALEALTRIWEDGLENFPESAHDTAITALRTAIAEAEKQEPVAWMVYFDARLGGARVTDKLLVWKKEQAAEQVKADLIQSVEPLYTAPPAAQRKPLTDEEIRKFADTHLFYQPEGYEVSGIFNLARAIEAAHGIKGEA
jgi:hypothetical protein